MDFTNILTSSNAEPSPPKPSEPTLPLKPSAPLKLGSPEPIISSKEEAVQADKDVESSNGVNGIKEDSITPNVVLSPAKHLHPPKPRRALGKSEFKRMSKELANIDDTVFSDTETGKFEEERSHYRERAKKRAREIEEVENRKRKVIPSTLCPKN
jgi:hypothetical protein